MTDQQPGQGPEQRLPVPREPAEVAPAERFTAPPQAHTIGLSAERAAKIVRQSGSSRWVAFLVVSLIVIFVIGYFFYELGVPGIEGSSRMDKETAAQQVTDVERGAELYTANCSRCHGDTGQGGIGPVLNEQAKLLTHLTPAVPGNGAHRRRTLHLRRPELADACLARAEGAPQLPPARGAHRLHPGTDDAHVHDEGP